MSMGIDLCRCRTTKGYLIPRLSSGVFSSELSKWYLRQNAVKS